MLRTRERETKLRYQIKLMEIQNQKAAAGAGAGGLAAGAGGAAGVGSSGEAGDDDEAWQIAAQEVIAEDAEDEGDGAAAAGARVRGAGSAGLSVEEILNGLTVHQHSEIVGEDETEVAMAQRARGVLGVRTRDSAASSSHFVDGAQGGGCGGAKKRGRPRKVNAQGDAPPEPKKPRSSASDKDDGDGNQRQDVPCGDGEGGNTSHAAEGGEEASAAMSIEDKKRAAQKIIEHNCKERLGLSWGEFLERFKASSEEEKKALWDRVK